MLNMDKQEPIIIHAVPFSIKHELRRQAEHAIVLLDLHTTSQMTLVYVAVKADDDSKVYCGMGVVGSENPVANLVVFLDYKTRMITAYSKASYPGILVTNHLNKTQSIIKTESTEQ